MIWKMPCACAEKPFRELLGAFCPRIINKQSYERGFGHGVVYKTKLIDAAEKSADQEEKEKSHFCNVKLDCSTDPPTAASP